MKPIERDIIIKAPPPMVFALAIDLERLPERVPAIKKIELLTDPPIGIGTKFRETRLMLGKEATEEMEFTAIEPDQSYVLEAKSMGNHYISTISFMPVDGGTRMTWRFAAEPLGTGARIIGTLLTPFFVGPTRRAIDDYLQAIKAAAEADGQETE